jgi:hypothetical protein
VLTDSRHRYPTSDLKFIIQDLPDTVQSAQRHIEEAFSFSPSPSSHNDSTIESDAISILTDSGSDSASSHSAESLDTTPSMDMISVARVSAEPHDFFAEQPRKGDGYSFCLKWVL